MKRSFLKIETGVSMLAIALFVGYLQLYYRE